MRKRERGGGTTPEGCQGTAIRNLELVASVQFIYTVSLKIFFMYVIDFFTTFLIIIYYILLLFNLYNCFFQLCLSKMKKNIPCYSFLDYFWIIFFLSNLKMCLRFLVTNLYLNVHI